MALWLTLVPWACRAGEEVTPPEAQTFAVGEIPRDLLYDGEFIWVANMGSDSVSKLTLDGLEVGEFPTGTLPQSLAFDGSHVWVATAFGEVVKLSKDGKMVGVFDIGGLLNSIVFDGRYIWVADTLGHTVTKIGRDGRVVETIPVGHQPSDLLYDGKNLWVANSGDDTVMKLDDEGRILLSTHVEQPGDLAFDGRNLWVTNTGFVSIPGSTVTKLDREGRLLEVFRVGFNPRAILYADKAIWVTNSLSDFNRTSNNVTKLSLNGVQLGEFWAGTEPYALAFDGAGLWTTNRVANSVTKLTKESMAHGSVSQRREELPVKRDPGYPRAMAESGIDPGEDMFVWYTDFSIHSVPYSEIVPGGPVRDDIRPLDSPNFTTLAEADDWLDELEPVIAFELDGDVRAYPLQVLVWHEIVNDKVAGVPVTVTYCPLCNSAIVFDRRVNGRVYDFGTSGFLRNFDLIMWDRQTESWWQQFSGKAIVGELTGEELELLPATIMSWRDFRGANPNGMVLSRKTGFARSYGENPYPGLDQVGGHLMPLGDGGEIRLPATERVAGVNVGDARVAFPYSILEREMVVNYTLQGEATDLVVFYEPETLSSFLDEENGGYRPVGSTGVFSPYVGSEKLFFELSGGDIVDRQTGSRWNILGQAVGGPMVGERLSPILHGDHFWFAWIAFNPSTKVYTGAR